MNNLANPAAKTIANRRLSSRRLPVLFCGICAAGNVLLIAGAHGVVTDATGARWKVKEIAVGCGLASIFTMGTFAALAWAACGSPRRAYSRE